MSVTSTVPFEPKLRATYRGLRKCKSCGVDRGCRSKCCQNKLCPEHNTESLLKTVDAIQLISYADTKLYSVRVKEKEFSHRNFVQITDVTLQSDPDNYIVSRNAICYVDTCKYDSSDVSLSCKHVKNSSETTKLAVELKIAHEVLSSLTISTEKKTVLWALYCDNETSVPAVQRVNKSTFAVKCKQNATFPAGRLHATILTDAAASKKSNLHSCACRRLKILLDKDSSVILQNDVCDHLLLLLAAILSTPALKDEFKQFTNALHLYWKDEDIFTFDRGLLPTEDMCDYSDIFQPLIELDTPIPNGIQNSSASTMLTCDPTLVGGNSSSSCDPINVAPDDSVNFLNLPNDAMYSGVENTISFSDCSIELMDQFELTDQIDLCKSDIIHSTSADVDLFQLPLSEPLTSKNDSSVVVPPDVVIGAAIPQPPPINPASVVTNLPQNDNSQIYFKLENLQELEKLLPDMTTSNSQQFQNVVHSTTDNLVNFQCTQDVVSSMSAASFPNAHVQCNQESITSHPSRLNSKNPKNLRMADNPCTKQAVLQTPVNTVLELKKIAPKKLPQKPKASSPPPSLVRNTTKRDREQSATNPEYEMWLDYVIERINLSIDFNAENPFVSHTFHVHEDCFAHFIKRFAADDNKRQLPDTVIVKKGKYKGLLRYTWKFYSSAAINRIFSSKNIAIEIRRDFRRTADNYRHIEDQLIQDEEEEELIRMTAKSQLKKILPKLCTAFIALDGNNNNNKTAFKIDWIPNVFPQSHYGVLNIDFSLGFEF